MLIFINKFEGINIIRGLQQFVNPDTSRQFLLQNCAGNSGVLSNSYNSRLYAREMGKVRSMFLRLLLVLVLTVLLALLSIGCSPDPENDSDPDPVDDPDLVDPELEDQVEEDPELDEPDYPEEVEVDEPLITSNYYWSWIYHGQLLLSTTEIIDGPHLFESDTGFIIEYTKAHGFNGELVWLVNESDVFELEWITLNFDVDYYDNNELEFELYFSIEIEDLRPEPGDQGIQSFEPGIVEEQDGFEVVIDKVILGKEQESSFTTDPIDYVALKIEMNVVDKP